MCPTGTSLPPHPTGAAATSEYHQAFNVIDTDHDGKISGEDLRNFYASFGNAEEEEMIKSMITIADDNKDGYVQYEEFERVLNRLKCNKNKISSNNNVGKAVEECYDEDHADVMKEVFTMMDQDGDGLLGLDDLRSYLGRVGLWVGDDEIMAMIRVGGGDDQHGVGFDGFVNILAMHDFS